MKKETTVTRKKVEAKIEEKVKAARDAYEKQERTLQR